MILRLPYPYVLAPMAGLTDSAFRRLVKRQGGCGMVVTEMVSSEGIVRGLDRTLEYTEYTEEERPVAVQIFGGDPENMARAAEVVESIGADVVDVNMGCPVPKVAKGNAGCRLMREPERAAAIVRAMTDAVRIPVTVKMRAGWNESEVNAPELAKRVADAGAAAIAVHGRTAAQSYSGHADWELIRRVAESVSIPVYGNGDCIEPTDLVERQRSSGVAGILVGRGVLRNPWIFAQAAALAEGRPMPEISLRVRGSFLIEYIDLLLEGDVGEAAGFRHSADRANARMAERPGTDTSGLSFPGKPSTRVSERWVINKIRALSAWYTRGIPNGAHLRGAVNHVESLPALRQLIDEFFEIG